MLADRPARIRRALLELVAERGFRGTSMAAVAERAGVAAGTAYVHYASKDELVMAAYLEVKAELGSAGATAVDPAAEPRVRFVALWHAIYAHLDADPDRARFLIQVEASPYAAEAHAAAMARDDDELLAAASAPDMHAVLADLPSEVQYDLGIAPAVRIVARGDRPDRRTLERVAAACWRAITND
jgi:TetR/AcrR family transcriptional repressor of multidrug resistance operon